MQPDTIEQKYSKALKQKRISQVLMLFMMVIICTFTFSKYGIGGGFHLYTLLMPLNGYEKLIDEIQAECFEAENFNLSSALEGECIHWVVGKKLGFKYANCTGNHNKMQEGGCCRDWSVLLAKIYARFGWRHIFVTYAPQIPHIRLDIYKEGAYCNIDIGHISCFKYATTGEVDRDDG